MRGKGRRNGRAFPGNGITPAYAGKSGHAINPNVCGQDHPRVCGEKSPFSLFRPPHLGSPPRMRGKVVHFFGAHLPDGITPAYAGKSSQTAEHPSIMQDHPRVCGEKFTTLHGENDFWGSPPRMRGKACGLFQLVESPGITPAYAGKSGWFQRRLQHGGGSPPRMRGKDLVKFCLCPRFGITPAYAGKSSKVSGFPPCCWDHPRVCGEKFFLFLDLAAVQGSPPRMRGKD